MNNNTFCLTHFWPRHFFLILLQNETTRNGRKFKNNYSIVLEEKVSILTPMKAFAFEIIYIHTFLLAMFTLPNAEGLRAHNSFDGDGLPT